MVTVVTPCGRRLLVNGDDGDAALYRFFQNRIQRVGGVRVDDQRVDILIQQVLDLLRLALDVDVTALDDQLHTQFSGDLFQIGQHLAAPFAANEAVGDTDAERIAVRAHDHRHFLFHRLSPLPSGSPLAAPTQ